jgi:EVE domain
MNVWWVTASERSEGGWHWGYFFSRPTQGHDWGGPEWIRSHISFARIRRMRRGDVIIAYQAGEGIVGMATLAEDGDQSSPGSPYDTFHLKAAPIIRLNVPVPFDALKLLPHAPSNFEFVRARRGTVFSVQQKGFSRLLGLLLAFNPTQGAKLGAFLPATRATIPYAVKAAAR